MSSEPLEFKIVLQPKQRQLFTYFTDSDFIWLGYGGSRGGGKSDALRSCMLAKRMKYPGTRGLIFRRTFDEVRVNHIESYLSRWPWLRDFYNVQNSELTLPNGSAIAFGYAENRNDIHAFWGHEYMDICIDQAEALTEEEVLFLKTCNRWPGQPETMCKMLLTFNPGNKGHEFLKRIFFTKNYRDHEIPNSYTFIQAYGWDNFEWARTACEKRGISERTYYYDWTDKQRFDFFVSNTQYGRDLQCYA